MPLKLGYRPYAYKICHKRLNLYICILNIRCLSLHEEIIPDLLDRLIRSIRIIGCVKHPIIVDENSLVVLDGIHRVAALKKLGCKRVPVCLIDYRNSAIKVRCWYRTINGAEINENTIAQIRQIGEIIEAEKVDEKKIGIKHIVAAMKDRERAIYIQYPFSDLREAYDIIKKIEEKFKKLGLRINYETEYDAVQRLLQKEVDAVIFTPKLNKDFIIKTALSGYVFSHKASRHIIPARPLYINAPLSLLLQDDRSLREINEELRGMLEKKCVEHIDAGSINQRRRYDEDLYIFVNSKQGN